MRWILRWIFVWNAPQSPHFLQKFTAFSTFLTKIHPQTSTRVKSERAPAIWQTNREFKKVGECSEMSVFDIFHRTDSLVSLHTFFLGNKHFLETFWPKTVSFSRKFLERHIICAIFHIQNSIFVFYCVAAKIICQSWLIIVSKLNKDFKSRGRISDLIHGEMAPIVPRSFQN